MLLRIILILVNLLHPLYLCFNLLLPDLLVSCVCFFHTLWAISLFSYMNYLQYPLPVLRVLYGF